MSAAAVIDALEFCRAAQHLSGSVPVASLKRLEDLLFDSDGALDYELQGDRDERDRAQLLVTVSGTLHLQCQRCLGKLEYELDVANRLLLLPQGAKPDDDELDDPEGPDVMEVTPALEVAGLIEDEVLLSLPLAPRHLEGACASRFVNNSPADGTPKAFAQLAALRQPRNPR